MYSCVLLLALHRAGSRGKSRSKKEKKGSRIFSTETVLSDFEKIPDSSLLTPDVNNILPEVCVECCAEADYYEGTDNIEGTPTLTDRLLEV